MLEMYGIIDRVSTVNNVIREMEFVAFWNVPRVTVTCNDKKNADIRVFLQFNIFAKS